ncbi:MAG: carotenoid 1,2-hydratase [Rhodoferax sp.]|uniref:lipocalin-like domain-containing protein n=1 Tax=Rhodoferax sp. TaxID=50421 RepID=UPI00260A3F4A|nr:carotenoid 1,2-hydratase [Rhodoferax sp.]MDD2879082.1 carotenoid 1,2-hydratase [Rhodoferax sp.]
MLQSPLYPSLSRRQLLATSLSAPLWPGLAQAQSGSTTQPSTLPAKRALQFPRDLGSHPDFAIEWWYITGQLQAEERQFGFQLTFFRSRVPVTQGMRSAFAAKQLIFAHAAVTDVAGKRLLHDQRIARASGAAQVDLASASSVDTDITLGNWSLTRQAAGYQAQASGPGFAFTLALRETQPLLLQGDQGLSRKGPQAEQMSFYYSLPQLQASGQLRLDGQTLNARGQAWLDHEWSQSLMHPDAVGWDWIGMNLSDGSALTAFRLRTKTGDALWSGGSYRVAGQVSPEVFRPEDVVFAATRFWKSRATGTTYPVAWSVAITRRTVTGVPSTERYVVNAVVDQQELDSRQSTGAIYWEGLSELFDSQGKLIGRGYLEMTGYASPLLI